jgi:fumarylacetoacetate (FAA) hydrolase
MKLGTLRNDTRDGALCVVAKDLQHAIVAFDIAPTLQAALDDWDFLSPQLQSLYEELNRNPSGSRVFEVDFTKFASPLPRAYQWADGSAYVNHVELVRKARGAEMPPEFWKDPLMYQGGSDAFLGPTDDIAMDSEDWGIDLEGEVAVITDDVPMGVSEKRARDHIRLVMLVNDVSLRNLIPQELAKGFGFFQSKPSSAFSPVAVTPDELGDMWNGERLRGVLLIRLNGEVFGKAETHIDMTFDFPTLIAHAAKTRPLSAGSIIGSGTVSNRGADGGPGKPVSEGGVGYSCIAELRMVETILAGAPKTEFLKPGDRVEMEMLDSRGRSIFGRIDQIVAG